MLFITTVTQKGQATIPVAIRNKLGIKPNSKVSFELRDNKETVIKPVIDFFSLKGSLKSSKPFNIDAMDKAVKKHLSRKYGSKPY